MPWNSTVRSREIADAGPHLRVWGKTWTMSTGGESKGSNTGLDANEKRSKSMLGNAEGSGVEN
jgi:hypothetical protein